MCCFIRNGGKRGSDTFVVVVLLLLTLASSAAIIVDEQCQSTTTGSNDDKDTYSAIPDNNIDNNDNNDNIDNNDNNDNKYDRLVEAFPAGGKVTVANVGGKINTDNNTTNYGLIAKTAIQKGEVILTMDQTYDAIFAERLRFQYPTLYERINDMIIDMKYPPTVDHVVLVLALLYEIRLGDESRFAPYVRVLPKTKSSFGGAYFWTTDEIRNCVVPRPSSSSSYPAIILRQQMNNVIRIVQKLSNSRSSSGTTQQNNDEFRLVPPRIDESNAQQQQRRRQEVAWAYVMVRTRTFDYGTGPRLVPMMDMANFDPTRALKIFAHNQYISLVAVEDIAMGEEIHNGYTNLCSCATAEKYGFVDESNIPFVNVPSIKADIMAMTTTTTTFSRDDDEDDDDTADLLAFCRKKAMLFFGNVPEQTLQANWEDMTQRMTMKPFRPTHNTYKCVRMLLLRSEAGASDQEMARYLVRKLTEDLNEYEQKASSSICNSKEGNYPLILKANRVQVRGLRMALEVAKQAAAGQIKYPDIPYP